MPEVVIYEYEKGWGKRVVDTRLYTSELEAKEFCLEYNKKLGEGHTPDIYFKAELCSVSKS